MPRKGGSSVNLARRFARQRFGHSETIETPSSDSVRRRPCAVHSTHLTPPPLHSLSISSPPPPSHKTTHPPIHYQPRPPPPILYSNIPHTPPPLHHHLPSHPPSPLPAYSSLRPSPSISLLPPYLQPFTLLSLPLITPRLLTSYLSPHDLSAINISTDV